MKTEIQDHTLLRLDFEQNQITAIQKEVEELQFHFQKEKSIRYLSNINDRDDHAEKIIRKFGEEILKL
jgi:hypothetical protein